MQDVQSGHAVCAARVRVRVKRSAGPGTGAMGTARGVQVRQGAPAQESARRRRSAVCGRRSL